MGSGENAIASAQLAQNVPGGFGFFDWMQYGLPLVILLVPLNWALLQLAIRVPKISIDTDPARGEIERLGGFSKHRARNYRRAAALDYLLDHGGFD